MGFLEPDERHGRGARPARLKKSRAIVIHSLDHARAAFAAAASLGVPLTILSGPGAGAYAGPAWFAEIVRLAQADHPSVAVTAILDCADQPGRALAALSHGIAVVRLGGNRQARARVAAIAAARGARLDDGAYATLDLAGCDDPVAESMRFLQQARPDLRSPLPSREGGRKRSHDER